MFLFWSAYFSGFCFGWLPACSPWSAKPCFSMESSWYFRRSMASAVGTVGGMISYLLMCSWHVGMVALSKMEEFNAATRFA